MKLSFVLRKVSTLILPLSLLFVLFNNFTTNSPPGDVHISDGIERFIPRRILIHPKTNTTSQELEQIINMVGGKQIGVIPEINLYSIELPATASEKAVEALLAHHPKLNFAELDRLLPSSVVPIDYYYATSWHLPKIGAPLAWEKSKGDGVTIAIIDSGVSPNHPDLAAKLLPGFNYWDNNTDSSDVIGHGTMVAGAAAAVTDNGIGVSGLAWASKIIPLRVTGLDGYGSVGFMANAIVYAANNGARIANLSFQAAGAISTIITATDYMRSKGGIVVSSAGNTYKAITQTSCTGPLNGIIVGATDASDTHPSWSSFGPCVTMSAPGVAIWATKWDGTYTTPAGTSFSAPIVSATAALVMSANPQLNADEVMNTIYRSALDLGTSGLDSYYGYGRVDVNKAVQMAMATVHDGVAPTLSLVNLNEGQLLKGIVNIQVNANDDVKIAKVELKIGSKSLGILTSAPFDFTLDTTQFNDGKFIISAIASDTSGNTATASTGIVIDNLLDTQAPIITSMSPSSGITIKSGSLTVSAAATDNEGVVAMTVFIDGALVASTMDSKISYTWDTRKISRGSHTISVNAKDASGNVGVKTVIVKK